MRLQLREWCTSDWARKNVFIDIDSQWNWKLLFFVRPPLSPRRRYPPARLTSERSDIKPFSV